MVCYCILDQLSLAKILGLQAPDDYDELNKSHDEPPKNDRVELESYVNIVRDQFYMASTIADQIGFEVLPNREVCIAGIKMAVQLMPTDPSAQFNYLRSLWTWISPALKSCTQASNRTRYDIAIFNKSKPIRMCYKRYDNLQLSKYYECWTVTFLFLQE